MSRPFAWEALYPPGLSWDFTPSEGTLPDLLDRAAAQFGDAVFLDYREHKISFTACADQACAVTAGLMRMGVQPGERVALYLPNSPYYPFSFFGVLRAGAVVVNLSPLDAERELAHKLHDSGATMLITTNIAPMFAMAQKLLAAGHINRLIVGDDAAFGVMPGLPLLPITGDDARIIDFAHLLTAPLPQTWPVLDAHALAALQYTGGTTGLPKGAIHTHVTLLASVEIYDLTYNAQLPLLDGQDRVIAVLPFFHIYGLIVLLLWQLKRGAALLLQLRFDASWVLHAIEVKRATFFPGVPTMWIALAAIPGIGERDFSSLRQVSSGGAPLPVDVASRFEALCGRRIGGGWGMTETASAGTSHLLTGAFDPHSVGVPLPGIEIKIVSLDGGKQDLPIGETGEMAVKGPNIFKGYHNKPESTEADFIDGYFLTGDIGHLDTLGMVHLVDRKKDMIISGGFNVYPTMIEAAIYEHDAVEECVVIGIADAYRGQAAKAFVKLREGAAPFSLDDLRGFLETRLGRHAMPSALEFRASLPKTPVGKLSKKELVLEEQKHG
ncbi:MAG: AMP-binding protein [Acidocella sp.]|nr:AMP-binding protein [Acidocella sp.]